MTSEWTVFVEEILEFRMIASAKSLVKGCQGASGIKVTARQFTGVSPPSTRTSTGTVAFLQGATVLTCNQTIPCQWSNYERFLGNRLNSNGLIVYDICLPLVINDSTVPTVVWVTFTRGWAWLTNITSDRTHVSDNFSYVVTETVIIFILDCGVITLIDEATVNIALITLNFTKFPMPACFTNTSAVLRVQGATRVTLETRTGVSSGGFHWRFGGDWGWWLRGGGGDWGWCMGGGGGGAGIALRTVLTNMTACRTVLGDSRPHICMVAPQLIMSTGPLTKWVGGVHTRD